MGSDIQPLALSAKGHGFVKNHAIGLPSLKISYGHLQSRPLLKSLSITPANKQRIFLLDIAMVCFSVDGPRRGGY